MGLLTYAHLCAGSSMMINKTITVTSKVFTTCTLFLPYTNIKNIHTQTHMHSIIYTKQTQLEELLANVDEYQVLMWTKKCETFKSDFSIILK